ncbi:MAG: cytochrome c [Methylacidiphilales bacterium]|nr:cytochrome c [Candidatus Methylacidiphilales bacterium]MDW8349686.1 cytochrome c [Verrucomicrobiae bacterium]
MRYYLLGLLLTILLVIFIAGRQGDFTQRTPIEIFDDMDRQQKIKPQKPSDFFPDGRAARMPIPGTIPTHIPVENEYLYTGRIGNRWGNGIPIPVTESLLLRGQERYSIHCAICHGATGAGNGITSQYGLVGIANLHQERLLKMDDGEIYNTITHGKGTMYGYGSNIQLEDRWAIVAYIRALQRSQNASLDDLPPEQRTRLTASQKPPTP